MADLSTTDRTLLREKWERRLGEEWAGDGESLRWVLIPEQGYAGSVVGGRPAVPHEPLNAIRPSDVDKPAWPLPSEVVSSGRFHGDEWADDPSLLWWAFADAAERDAVRFADHLAAVPGQGVLALSSTRLAVVVEQGKLGAEQEQAEGSGWLGRAKSAAAKVQKAAEGLAASKDAKAPVSYFEVPRQQIGGVDACRFGRSIPRRPFLRVGFRDGSTLLVRNDSAEDLAGKFHAGA